MTIEGTIEEPKRSSMIAYKISNSLRYRILLGLVLALLIPYFIRSVTLSEFSIDSAAFNSILGVSIAVICGVLANEKLASFPSLSAATNIIVGFTLPFASMMIIFLLFRFDYSRSFFFIGYFTVIVSFLVFYFLGLGKKNTTLAIIPGGNTTELLNIAQVKWTILKDTKSYAPMMGPVVADLRAVDDEEWLKFMADISLRSIPVYHSKQISESLTGKVEIEHLSENTFGSLIPDLAYVKLKAILDWCVALALIIPVGVFLLIIAALIKFETKGSAMFIQNRIGFRGKIIKVFKLRTMRVASPTCEDNEVNQIDLRNKSITKNDDDRVTRLGKFLRKTRIDELPQIINVLKGEMSWIGPRPEAVSLSEWYQEELPFYSYRHIVRPGISGWAQVNQGHVADRDEVHEKLKYDFFYIKNFSPWLDLLIVFTTMKTMLSGFGAK